MAKQKLMWAFPGVAFVVALAAMLASGPSWASLMRRTLMSASSNGTVGCKDCCSPSAGLFSGGNAGAGGNNLVHCALGGEDPVNYYTGEHIFSTTDLKDGGFDGMNVSRAFVTMPQYTEFIFGSCWRWGVPQLIDMGNQVNLVMSSRHARSWTKVFSGPNVIGYTPDFFYKDTLTIYDANTLVFKNENGNSMTFYNFTYSDPNFRGKLYQTFNSYLVSPNPGGVSGSYVQASYTAGGVFAGLSQQEETSGVVDFSNYDTLTANLGGSFAHLVVTSIFQFHYVAGIPKTVRSTSNEYYDGTDPANGPAGSLKRVTIFDPAVSTIEKKYYRYGTAGTKVTLRTVLEGAAYERLLADPAINGNDALVLTATETLVNTYANTYVYDANGRTTSETIQGKGTCSFSAPTDSGFANDVNSWARKVVETKPDGSTNTVFTTYTGQKMLSDFQSGTQHWLSYYQYDSACRLISEATPSAVASYTTLNPPANLGVVLNTGGLSLINLTNYGTSTTATTSTAGDVLGYVKSRQVKNGSAGTPITTEAYTYKLHTSTALVSVTTYILAQKTVYENTDGTGARTTDYTYTWLVPPGTTTESNQIASIKTQFPSVATANNGSGARTQTIQFYDKWRHPTWLQDEDSYIQMKSWDRLTGGCTQSIVDFNTVTHPGLAPSGWATPAGGGLHLVTTYGYMNEYLARPTSVTDPSNNITYKVYKDASWEVRTYPGWTGTATTGPTQVSRLDKPGSYRETLTMSAAPNHPSGFPDGTEGIASVITDTRESLDSGNRVVNRDSYFGPPAWVSSTTYGALGSNFYRMSYGYDSKGRMNHSVDWTGTIRDTTYDGRDRVTQTKIGTNDTGAPNMIQDFGYEYDGNLIGNDTLTKSRQFTSASVSLDTIYTNDFRDRLTQTKTPDSVITVRTLNNLSEVTQEQTYAGSVSAANLRSQSQSLINEKRQAYQTIAFNVDPTNGTVGHSLTYNLWYNGRGSQIKSKGPNGQFQKTQYDGARRVTAQFVCYDDSELNTDYLQAFSVNAGVGFTGDTVIEETVNAYDSDGNLIQTTSYRRTPGTALLGDLGTAWAVADSRRTFTAQWFDPANRITSFVDYGTNGGATFTRPGTPPAPSSSLTILVTQYSYDTGGRQNDVHDNKNRLTSKTFDGLNRVTQTVENYVTGIPVDQSLDRERTTYVTFDMGGRVSTRVAKNPKGLFNGVEKQMTTYVYGTAANPARNDLLIAEIYPDSDDIPSPLGNGPDAVYDRVEYTYDYASRRSTIKDQRATVRTWNYDATTGRLTSEAVTTLGTGVDGAVQRKEYAYDGVSRLLTATSYSAPSGGTVVNEVKYTYDGYWNAIKREENHAGVVGGGTPSYQVAYADGGAPAKYVRPSSMTYPNGGIVYVNYQADTTGSGKLSRIDNFSSVANDPHSGTTTPYAVYNYLGAGNIMDITHPRITTLGTDGLVYRVGSDGNPGAWDVLGRVIETKWRNTANNNSLDLLDYIYDATSNRTTRQINSTIKPALGQEKDEAYTYDGLDRLTKENRGLLSGGTITDANRNFGQNWNALESLGNWRGFQVAPTGGSSYSFIQTRSHNWANEIDIDNNDNLPPGVSISNSWIAPTYDKAGNTTTSPVPGNETAGYFYTYNAWNRLVKVQNGTRAAPGTEVAEYQYDAQNYRIAKLVPNGSNWDRTDCYYNFRWQCVEERKNLNVVGKTTVATIGLAQYVWDLRYSDAPIVRFRNADGSADGSLEEKLYYCQDANFNTNTLVNESTGAVVERYIYDAYGKASLFDLNWNAQASTVYRNEILFAGYRFDPESALYNVRNRVYHPTLGRWLQRDPLSYDAGSMDLYEYCLSAPIVNTDPMGLLTPASNPCDDAYVACRAHCIGRTGKELEWCVESCEQDADHCYKEHRALGQRLPFHIGVTKLTIIIYGTGAAIQGGVLAGTIGAGAVATGGAAAGVVGAGTSGIVPTGVVAGTTTAGAAAWLNMSAQVQALQAQLTLLFYQLRLTCDETGKQVLWGQIRAIEAAIEQILNRMKNF